MYPSRVPVLYVLTVVGIFLVILVGMGIGCFLGQPMALLLVMGLNFLPEFPLVPESNAEEDAEEVLYEAERAGTPNRMGFGPILDE